MDTEKLNILAESAINDYFDDIDHVVDNIVSKIAELYKIEDDDDINYLKKKIMRGILKLD